MLGALVFLFAVSWASGLPATQEVAFPEDVRGNIKGRSNRIVSGWEASEGQIPYQLSLRMVSALGNVSSCGAIFIHNEWALTAAHCVDNRKTFIIRFGATTLLRPVEIFETSEYYVYPTYIEGWPFVQVNDIGLIKLNRFVEYSDLIQPVRLQPSALKNKNYEGVILQASGWGLNWTSNQGGVSPLHLNWVYLVGESNEECSRAYNFSPTIVDSTICVNGYNETSQSTCSGDSGGPLVDIDVDGKPTIVGVTSFVSIAGCHAPIPAGFIRPGHYHDWFFEVTGINFDWDPESLLEPELNRV